MATVKSLLDGYVRTSLNDKQKSRWDDDNDLLQFLQIAVTRTNAIGLANSMPFMKGKKVVELASGEESFPVPTDFYTPISLVNTGTRTELTQKRGEEWDVLPIVGTLSAYLIEDGKVYVREVSAAGVELSFRYFTKVNAEALTLSSQMPWDGALNYIIGDYVLYRAKNTDRFSTQSDIAALNELEQAIYAAYGRVEPLTIKSKGWLP